MVFASKSKDDRKFLLIFHFYLLHLQNLMGSTDGNHDSSVFRLLKTKTKRHSTFIERFWMRHRQNLSLYSRLNSTMHQCSHSTKSNQNSNVDTVLPNDIQLHCLDATTLLSIHNRNRYRPESIDDASSLANSSLDLEWEHEKHNTSWLILQEDYSSGSDDNGSTSEMSRRTPNKRSQCKQMLNHASLNSSRQNSRQDILPHRAKYSNNRRSKSNNSWSHISTPDSLEWDVHEDDQKFKSEEDLLDHETMELLHEIEWLKNRALDETGEHIHWENREQQS